MLICNETGLPQRYRDSVRAIQPGLPLFLYNYTTHQLHGVFEVSINLDLWNLLYGQVCVVQVYCRFLLSVFWCLGFTYHCSVLFFSPWDIVVRWQMTLYCTLQIAGFQLWGFKFRPNSMGRQEMSRGVQIPCSGVYSIMSS